MQKKRKPLVERLPITKRTHEVRPQRVQIEHRLVHIENERFRLRLAAGLRWRGGAGRRNNAGAFATHLRKKIRWAGHQGGPERGGGQRELSSAHVRTHLFLLRVLVSISHKRAMES